MILKSGLIISMGLWLNSLYWKELKALILLHSILLGLTSLTLPSSLTSIDRTEMHGMGGESNPFSTLKTMTVKATTPPTLPDYGIPIPTTISSIYVPKYSANIYKAIDNWNTYADKIQALPQNETVVTYNDGTTKKFDIKGNLTQTSIENKKDITKVIIGDDVTNIGYLAFADCRSHLNSNSW